MELYEKGKNVSLVSNTIQDINDEMREALATEDDCTEDRIDVIEVKASARLRNLVPTVLHRCKSEGTKGFYAVIVGHGAAVQKVVTLGEMVRKRLNNKNVQQWNSIRFTEESEEWIPKYDNSQLEDIKVARKLPFMAVLITTRDWNKITLPNWTKQVQLQNFLNVNGNKNVNKSSQQSSRKKTRKKSAPINS